MVYACPQGFDYRLPPPCKAQTKQAYSLLSLRSSVVTPANKFLFSLSFSFSLYYLHAVGKGFINHIFRPYACLYFA